MLHSRDKRVEESIRQALSNTIQFEMNDPRVPPIFTITHVAVSKDLRHAKVHYSQIPDGPEDLEKTDQFLKDSAGFLRNAIARSVNLKFTPALFFEYDPSQKEYERINTRLQQIRRPDAEQETAPADEDE